MWNHQENKTPWKNNENTKILSNVKINQMNPYLDMSMFPSDKWFKSSVGGFDSGGANVDILSFCLVVAIRTDNCKAFNQYSEAVKACDTQTCLLFCDQNICNYSRLCHSLFNTVCRTFRMPNWFFWTCASSFNSVHVAVLTKFRVT